MARAGIRSTIPGTTVGVMRTRMASASSAESWMREPVAMVGVMMAVTAKTDVGLRGTTVVSICSAFLVEDGLQACHVGNQHLQGIIRGGKLVSRFIKLFLPNIEHKAVINRFQRVIIVRRGTRMWYTREQSHVVADETETRQ